MSKPGQPVDEEGRPVFPSAVRTPEGDDVHGHAFVAIPPEEDEEDDSKPHVAL